MPVEAKIIEGSVNPFTGVKITTFLLTYPRYIHSEFMTHRVFSRNAASSRAIPIEKIQDSVFDNPAHPEQWGANQKGMQAGEEIKNKEEAKRLWFAISRRAILESERLNSLGLHKQIVNRVLEPYSHITVVATTTMLSNFFALRAHKDAQPEFQLLAYKMLKEYLNFLFEEKNHHLPFILPEERFDNHAFAISAARCARVSYVRQNEIKDIKEDIALCERLQSSGHWSPFEHQAIASNENEFIGNFHGGWKQWRQMLEEPKEINLEKILEEAPQWIKNKLL